MSSPRPSALQQQILDLLAAAATSLSTGIIRHRVNDDRGAPIGAERVYAALMGLHRRGLVRRARGPHKAKVYWERGIVRVRDAG